MACGSGRRPQGARTSRLVAKEDEGGKRERKTPRIPRPGIAFSSKGGRPGAVRRVATIIFLISGPT